MSGGIVAIGRGARLVGVLLLACVAAGQDTSQHDLLQALKHGSLVVWVVRPGASTKKPTGMPLPEFRGAQPGYHEATPSTLGQTAGSYGQTAGSYGVDASSAAIAVPAEGAATRVPGAAGDANATAGPGYAEQTSGSYGQTAGTFGTDASNHGQTAGSLGQTSGSYGTASSNTGRTAGSFGESLSTIATAGQPKVVAPPKTPPQRMHDDLAAAYPGLRTVFVDVESDKLAAALKAPGGDKPLPDVLLYVGFPVGWAGPSADVNAMEVSSSGGYAPPSSNKSVTTVSAQCVVLRKAPHPKVAAAYMEYLEERGMLSAAAK